MTKEQEKAIEKLKSLKEYNTTYYGYQWFKVEVKADDEMKNTIDTILNLIQTQQNDIQRMQELLDLSDANNVKKDKIINLMSNYIVNLIQYNNPEEVRDAKEIKQYFERKITSNKQIQ